MPMTVEQIAAEAMHLPTEARAQLADQLVESLDAADLDRIDHLWSAEATRRLDEIIKGKVETISGDEALVRARRVATE
jgi:putative addiction module component (TIGR02574 family)